MGRVKNKIHALLFWQTRIGETLNRMYDLRIFYKYSFYKKSIKHKKNYESFLTKQYHIIEKGLAMPHPRENFGVPKIKELISVSYDYFRQFGKSQLLESIAATLTEYLRVNETFEKAHPTEYKLINDFIRQFTPNNKGGVRYVSPTTSISNYAEFVETRASIRHFGDKNVTTEYVEKAIEIARHSPSVCNRQNWKVHLYTHPQEINQLLRFQDGNNGFGNTINKLLIITSDSKGFTNLEGNQIYIDGGLFTMNLLLSLHSLGIGSCCLNLCVPYTKEKAIKEIGNIHESERLIMMIGVGYFSENTKVALSDKKSVEEILVEHDESSR